MLYKIIQNKALFSRSKRGIYAFDMEHRAYPKKWKIEGGFLLGYLIYAIKITSPNITWGYYKI